MKKTIHNITIEAIKGDITQQPDIAAIINAANPQLRTGGGVAGAIHSAAGPELEKEARQYAPIQPGESVITSAHNLPNKFVIHCLGPVYGRDKPEETLLANCYNNALDLAEEKGIESVAFPSISTGAFGYPKDEATEIALKAVKDKARELKKVKLVRFVLFSQQDLELFKII